MLPSRDWRLPIGVVRHLKLSATSSTSPSLESPHPVARRGLTLDGFSPIQAIRPGKSLRQLQIRVVDQHQTPIGPSSFAEQTSRGVAVSLPEIVIGVLPSYSDDVVLAASRHHLAQE